MAVTFAGYPSIEVAPTTLAAITLPGLGLTYNASGVLAASGGALHAILMSEVIEDQTWMNRVHIYSDIDFGAYNRIGETSSVAKAWKGMTVTGLLMKTSATVIPAGSGLVVDTDGKWKINADSAVANVALVIDAINAGATYSGKAHLV